MIFAKFQCQLYGQFWIEIPLRGNQQAEQFAYGLSAGWRLGRDEQFQLVDIRLSRHPTEVCKTLEELKELLQPAGQSQSESSQFQPREGE